MIFQQFRPILLASKSPRRREYLERYKLQFRVYTGEVDEKAAPGESPEGFVYRMAEEKARSVREHAMAEEIILGADTIVLLNDQIIGKPDSQDDVYPMLSSLNGRVHRVLTSYCLLDLKQGLKINRTTQSEVEFFQTPDELVKAYANTKEPLDKAGSYSIQSNGTFLVKEIRGSYNNVVGLPIEILIIDLIENGYIAPVEI